MKKYRSIFGENENDVNFDYRRHQRAFSYVFTAKYLAFFYQCTVNDRARLAFERPSERDFIHLCFLCEHTCPCLHLSKHTECVRSNRERPKRDPECIHSE